MRSSYSISWTTVDFCLNSYMTRVDSDKPEYLHLLIESFTLYAVNI